MHPAGTPARLAAALLALALAVGAAAFAMDQVAWAPPDGTDPELRAAMLRAALGAAAAYPVIRAERERRGLAIDRASDPNLTGVIGVEWSPISTTLGSLRAKRTATNPNMAALLVRWLQGVGAGRGSVVAIGVSGSFPGLAIAAVAAAQALGAVPLVAASVASSSWGANDPAFTWLDMEGALVAAGLFPRSIGASPGGEDDVAAGIEDGARALLAAAIERSGVTRLTGGTLSESVTERVAAYDRAAGGRPLAAFVNVGGAAVNLGGCLGLLGLAPGAHRGLPRCNGEPGVMWQMAERGVPVIHLLHVEGIAASGGMPVDPVPLPRPGRGAPFGRPPRLASAFLLTVLAAGTYLLAHRARA